MPVWWELPNTEVMANYNGMLFTFFMYNAKTVKTFTFFFASRCIWMPFLLSLSCCTWHLTACIRASFFHCRRALWLSAQSRRTNRLSEPWLPYRNHQFFEFTSSALLWLPLILPRWLTTCHRDTSHPQGSWPLELPPRLCAATKIVLLSTELVEQESQSQNGLGMWK